MALGGDYVGVSDLAAFLSIGDAADNAELGNAVSAASRWVTSYCDRDFGVATAATARVFRAVDRCSLRVDDISTTTGLVVQTDDDDDGTFETTWATTDYQLEPINGIVAGVIGWPYTKIVAVESNRFPTRPRRAAVQVTAKWGWPAIPKPVQQATLVVAAALFKRRDSAEGVLGGFGDFSPVRVGVRVDPDVERLLMPYRIFPVAVA